MFTDLSKTFLSFSEEELVRAMVMAISMRQPLAKSILYQLNEVLFSPCLPF